MLGDPPTQAVCKSCGRSSDVVCAACHYGFHHMSGCGLGSGANKEYFQEINESFPVCPDCMWIWVQFLCTCPSVIPLHHQNEVLTIMNASAASFEALHCSITNFVKDFTFRNAVSKDTVIRALQGHMGFAQPSLGSATVKIEELMVTGQIEVIKGICRWNHSLDALPQVTDRVLPSRSTATSRKMPFFSLPS